MGGYVAPNYLGCSIMTYYVKPGQNHSQARDRESTNMGGDLKMTLVQGHKVSESV